MEEQMMKETNVLEYKETVSKSFLKTVSAFSNYAGGTIMFGIDDNGNFKGIPDIENVCLAIENMINDHITPQPSYHMEIDEKNNVISLEIQSGIHKPYLYKSKAYKRNDTSTIEVDALELTRLVLEGKNINFEELPSHLQELSFHYLEQELRAIIKIEQFNTDTLKTLNLYHIQSGYNNAANILSDDSTFPGIDIAKFGETSNILQKRTTLEHMSILEGFHQAVRLYQDYYQYEEIEGSYRRKKFLIPEEAYRESLANALIHRAWDLKNPIRISMYDDRIELFSPGGLTSGITKEEYLSGKVSVLRNPIIGNIFYRLGIVEIFGTGIRRIKDTYQESVTKPSFQISDNVIQIILPVIHTDDGLNEVEKEVYQLLSKSISKSVGELSQLVSFGKSKLKETLKTLVEKGIVTVEGRGRGTKYHL